MSADLTSLVTGLTESTNAVSAMIASLVTLFGVLRFKRRARAEVAPALVRGSAGTGLATLLYMSNAVPHDAMTTPGLPSATIYTPQGTVTKLPRWVTSTHTPLVIIGILLIALFDVTSLRRTPEVGPVFERVAPVIAHAQFTYDGSGNIVFNVAGTYDGLDRMTRVSIPTSSSERSDFSWVTDLAKVNCVGRVFSVFDLEQLRQKDGLRTTVVDLQQIYDDFSNGNTTPHAIRSLIASAMQQSPRPRYGVLAGTGTLDYRGIQQAPGPVPPMMVKTNDGLFASDVKIADANNDGIPDPGNLIAARLTLRSGDRSTYSVVRVGGDVAPVSRRAVYVYANGLGDDVRNTDSWIKIGESTLTPSGTWSVVGTLSDDWSRTHTTPVANANISLTAIVVSPEDGVTTTSTLADLDAMGRSEIVTVVPRRGLERGQGTSGVAGDPSCTTPATGVLRWQ